MGKGVSVLVIFACKALGVIFAGLDRAFLGSFGLVGQHVRFQVLEDATTFWNGALAFFSGFIIKLKACAPLT
jgi:hypothetical protein